MRAAQFRVLALAAGFWAMGCSVDLMLPEPPAAGSLVGAIDTQPAETKVAPGNLTVNLINVDGIRQPATTDADGGFSYASLLPGVYVVELNHSAFAPLIVPNVRVLSGQVNDIGVLLPVSRKNTIDEGRIIGGVTGPGGANVSGTSVQFLLEPNDDLLASVTVGFDGLFSVKVPPGSYHLKAVHPDFITAERSGIVVEQGATVDLRTMPLALGLNPSTLTGTVLVEVEGAAAAPAAAAIITLSTGATTTTSATGAFTLTGLPAGSFTLRVGLTSYNDPAPDRIVQLKAGQTTTVSPITLNLVRGSIEGTVELSDRAPIDIVSVSAVNAATQRGYAAVVSADPTQPYKGTFTIPGVPLGSYEVQAAKVRYSRATTTVTVAGPVTTAGNLVLALQQGDFLIDDADSSNVAGFTRSRDVTLRFTGFPATGVTSYRVSEDSSFADAGFDPYTGIQQPYTIVTAGDGVKTVFAQYRDNTGSTSPTFQNSITLDTVAPPAPGVTITSTGTPNGNVRFSKANQVLPLTIVASDDRGLAAMKVAGTNATDPDGGLLTPRVSVQGTTTFTRSSSADGPQTVYVQVIDNAGNISPLGQDTIIVDATPPTVSTGTLSIPRGARATVDGFTNTPFVDVLVNATPAANGEALYVKLANAAGAELDAALFSPVRSSFSWILTPADNLKTVSAILMDSAGNTSAVANATITLDTQPPSPVSATLAQGLVRASPVRVNVSSTAPDLSPTQALATADNQSFPNAAGPLPAAGFVDVALTTIPAAPGVYPATVYARFRDRAGNDSVVTLPLTIDTEAPTGSIELLGTLADGTTNEKVTTSASVSVIHRIVGASAYVLGDETMASCPAASSASYLPMPAGDVIAHTLTGSSTTRTVRGCFRDAAGNVFRANDVTIGFDNAPPAGCTLTLSGKKRNGSAAPVGRTGSADVDFTIGGCDAAPEDMLVVNGTVTCSNSLAGWGSFRSADTITVPAFDGTKTISACVRDAARNVASLTSASIQLDMTPPLAAASQLEFGEGVLDLAEGKFRATDGGVRVAIAVSTTWADAVEMVLNTRVGRNFTADAGTLMTPTSPPPTSVFSSVQGTQVPNTQLYDVPITGQPDGLLSDFSMLFRDDVGNETQLTFTSVLLDVVAPTAPTMTGVVTGNRSATLFWVPTQSKGVEHYDMGTTSGATFLKRGQATSSAREGAAIGLDNREEYQFAVRAVDFANNPSPASNAMTGTAGWRGASIPINSPYPLRPFDVAVSGDDIYMTFSERDVDGTVETGNLKMAHSADRGRTWEISTIDGVFGWNRKIGHIDVQDGIVTVVTVGSDQDPTTTNFPTQGEAKLYTSTDGKTWTKWTDANLQNQANWGEVGGAGVVVSGGVARMFYVSNNGTTNLVRSYLTAITTGFFFLIGAGLTTYYDAPDGVPMNDLKVCNGNYLKVLGWRDSSLANSITHRFVFDGDYSPTEGATLQIQSGSPANYDLACASLAGRTNAYAVYTVGTTLGFRGKQGSSPTWLGNLTSQSDIDVRYPPRIHAAGSLAYMVYRPTTGGVKLGVVQDTSGSGFNPTVWRRVEANSLQGHWPVIGGEAIDDVVIGYTDADAATLTVLVPELRGVTGRGLPGINTANIAWNSGGLSDFMVTTAADTFFFPELQSYFVSTPSFDVTAPTADPLMHRIGARDAFGQSSNEGEVWQVAPFVDTTIFNASPVGSGSTSTAGVVAHDDSVLVLPPYGTRTSGDSDLTVYRSTNYGANWVAVQPPAAMATTAARSMDGAQGRVVLAYRQSAAAGVRARLFSTINATYPAETNIDLTIGGDHIAVGTDRVARFAIVSSNQATDQIGVAWSDDGISFTVRNRITIPSSASYSITDVAVWRVDLARLIIAWRQSASGSERIYFAESIDKGVTFGTPVLFADGTTGVSGNQFVNTATISRGAGNDAYSLFGHVSQSSASPPRSANIYLTITGTDHPATATNFTQFILDQDPAVPSSFDLLSTSDGHAVVYQTTNLVGSVTETSLKMAVCTADCHSLKNWYRRPLATYAASAATRLSPIITQSTTSGQIGPRWYVVYREAGQLRILRGGLVRRMR